MCCSQPKRMRISSPLCAPNDRLLLSGFYVVPLFHSPDQWIAASAKLARPKSLPRYGPASGGATLDTCGERSPEAIVPQAGSRLGAHPSERRVGLRDANENDAMMIIFFLAILLFLSSSPRCGLPINMKGGDLRLGKYARTAGPGLYLLIPLIEWQVTIDMAHDDDLRRAAEAITRDNVPIKINAVIWAQDGRSQTRRHRSSRCRHSVVQVAITSLRNVIGQHTLDDVLKEQETISRALQISIDTVTEPWA